MNFGRTTNERDQILLNPGEYHKIQAIIIFGYFYSFNLLLDVQS